MLNQYEKLGLFALGMVGFVFIAPRALSFVLGGAALMVTPPSKLPGANAKPRESGRRVTHEPTGEAGFSETAVEEAGGDWLAASAFNDTLAALRGRRLGAVAREGALQSKVAWKIAVSQQAALYHIVALADGAAVLWNARNPIAAALAARGVVEACAVLADFARELERLAGESNLAAIDALVMSHSFANALDGVADSSAGDSAGRMAALLQAAEPVLPGASAAHAQLSALADAAASARFGAFGILDKTSTAVAFREAESFDRAIFAPILAGLQVAASIDGVFAGIEEVLPKVAALS